MAKTGNTMWNGNYGADESKRRQSYDAPQFKLSVEPDPDSKFKIAPKATVTFPLGGKD